MNCWQSELLENQAFYQLSKFKGHLRIDNRYDEDYMF